MIKFTEHLEQLEETKFRKGKYEYKSVGKRAYIYDVEAREEIYDIESFYDDFEDIIEKTTNPTLAVVKIDLPKSLQNIRKTLNKRDRKTLDTVFEQAKHAFLQILYADAALRTKKGDKGKRGNYTDQIPRTKPVG